MKTHLSSGLRKVHKSGLLPIRIKWNLRLAMRKEIFKWKEEANKKEKDYLLEIQNREAFVQEKNVELEECRFQIEKQKKNLTLRESELVEATSKSQELSEKLDKKEEENVLLEEHLREEKQSLENKIFELKQCRIKVSDLKEQLLEKDLKKKKFIQNMKNQINL